MTAEELCKKLNNAEINLLADLFLDFLGIDRSTSGYRRLRNAVIAAPSFSGGMPALYVALGELENADPELIESDVENTLKNINVSQLFNSAYGTEGKLFVEMPHMNAEDSVLFLATVFEYIRYTNYNR